MAKCNSCGAPIIWVRTKAGKSMPCDARPVVYWEKAGAAGKVVTPNGDVRSCVFEGDAKTATGVGFISHFATCPHADMHRSRISDQVRCK